ncbi:MAG TPA: GIY-YIG nuclease family protein [Ignavibacteriaceae bacterium]|nr:GIY-YIG nuclease family protein [Ignavibacteriaceae bacterium]HRP91256.1 GIY-YIG nuclease family protein [Ignavibacteriaceae bacterium]
MFYFVYVIKSKEGFIYKGMTDNLERRLEEHNNKTLSFWTKRDTEWKLVYSEKFSEKSEALKREHWLKTGVGREFLAKILKQD